MSQALRPATETLLISEQTPELLAVIDAVRHVHDFPAIVTPIPVRLDPELPLPGRYRVDRQGRPASITVKPRTRAVPLGVLHEVGHYVDHHAMPPEVAWASSPGGPLDGWLLAVQESEAFARLEELAEDPPLPAHRTFFLYSLEEKELFARSYAQYVTVRSGSQILGDLLDDSRARLHYPEYWANYDFEPVSEALDAAFGGLGWSRP